GVTGGISGLSASGFTGGIPELNAAAAAGIGSGVGLGPEVAAVTRSISGSGGAAGFGAYLPIPKVIYLIIMNILIGLKVACSFFSIFYRFTAFERR
ncbi:MAG: hypothetical protein FWH55_09380, partial [Oscillospiraceae bacterium]|nr:hypothetical protein [Oscillospiraceae bacterium]